MRKIEPELIAGMGYIGDNPGVLYRMGGAGEQTVVTGNPALLEGVKGSRFTSLTIHGKSTQGSTTGAQLYSTMPTEGKLINGITFGVKDGGLSLKGTAEGAQRNDDYFFKKGIELSPGTYTISFSGKGNLSEIEVGISGDDKNMLLSSFALYNAPRKLTLSEAKTCYVVAQSRAGKSVDCTIYIMLNAGSEALPWEPYTGGAPSPSPSYPQEIESAGMDGEISVKVGRTEMDKNPQVVIIPTPSGLPGIPVSSGGNYTDEKGQQWVADEIDLAKGEKVQWIEKLDLKSLSWAKQSRMSNAGGFWFSSKIKSASLFGLSVKGTISNIGICKNPYTDVGDYVWTLTNEGNSEVRIGFTDSMIDTLEKLTNLLNSLPEAYAMYCLAEPIRTPLPPETIAAYKKIHTYSPTTTVINESRPARGV